MFDRNRSLRLCTIATTLGAGLMLCMSVRAECESGETVVSPSENVNYVQAPDETMQNAPAAELPPRSEQPQMAPPPARRESPPAAEAPVPLPRPEERMQGQNVPNNERPVMRGENAPGAPANRLENSALAPLSFMVGNWTLDTHMSPDARHAANADMHGFETVRPALNGNAIIGNLDLQGPNNMSFKGHLVITPNQSGGDRGHASANAKPADQNATNAREEQPQNVSADKNAPPGQNTGAENTFSVFWVDSMGVACFTNDATWDGTKLTVNGTSTTDGKQEKIRTTYSRTADNRVDIAMDRDSGDGWKNEFKGTMTRVTGRMMGGENRPGAEMTPPSGHAAPPPPHAAPPPAANTQAPNTPAPQAAPPAPSAPQTSPPNQP